MPNHKHTNIIIGTEISSTTLTVFASNPLNRQIKTVVAQVEKTLILDTLDECRWNRKIAADVLAISYRNILYKMKEYGLSNKRII